MRLWNRLILAIALLLSFGLEHAQAQQFGKLIVPVDLTNLSPHLVYILLDCYVGPVGEHQSNVTVERRDIRGSLVENIQMPMPLQDPQGKTYTYLCKVWAGSDRDINAVRELSLPDDSWPPEFKVTPKLGRLTGTFVW